jgi:hypothetical protein
MMRSRFYVEYWLFKVGLFGISALECEVIRHRPQARFGMENLSIPKQAKIDSAAQPRESEGLPFDALAIYALSSPPAGHY